MADSPVGSRRAAGTTLALILAGTALACGTTALIQGFAPSWSRGLRLALSYVVIVLPLAIVVRDGTRFGFRREGLANAVVSGIVLAAVTLAFGRPTLFAAPPSVERLGMLGALAIVGVVEEAMFRGVLQSQLIAWVGRWRGLLTTAVLFSVWHIPQLLLGGAGIGDVAASLGLVFVTGMVLGLYMLGLRNIAGPAMLHTAINWLG